MRVLVLGGSGRVGFTLAALLSRHLHCHVTVTSAPQNRQKLLDLGLPPDSVIDHAQVERLRGGFDAAFDTQGSALSEALCVRQLRAEGAYVTFNGSLVARADAHGFACGLVQGVREGMQRRAQMRAGARGARFEYALFAPDGAALGKLMGMADRAELVCDVAKVFDLDEIGNAYEFCSQKGGSGKVVIDVAGAR
jgi:NADPH:quinone reductase-like Zn-dependent oxidoreductase